MEVEEGGVTWSTLGPRRAVEGAVWEWVWEWTSLEGLGLAGEEGAGVWDRRLAWAVAKEDHQEAVRYL